MLRILDQTCLLSTRVRSHNHTQTLKLINHHQGSALDLNTTRAVEKHSSTFVGFGIYGKAVLIAEVNKDV